MHPTIERIREVFHYDLATGILTWRVSPNRRIKVGSPAGTLNHGYLRVTFDGIKAMVHCVAWAWVTGEWPENDIDHEDLNRANNKWINLRCATRSQNKANTSAPCTNTSGIKGVTAHGNRWIAQIKVAGRRFHLGVFDTKGEAGAAYAAASRLHFGDFARIA